MIDLNEKVVIVTGGTRGIGLAIVDRLSEAGANVVICSSSEGKSEAIAQDISDKYNTTSIGIQTDVSSFESCENLIKTVMDKFGRIDILVNNAGITRDNLLLRMKPDDFNSVINTNLGSVFNTTKLAIRPMLKQKSGKIINMSSVVGLIGNPGQANYAASKAGMFGFSKSIAKEFGAKGITCNCIAPGFIETDMIKTLPEERLNNIISEVPLKRLGTVDDVANMVLFLASDLSNYITGEVFAVDGGIQM
jgi:3-oxoacyl-[acyl-carrier protein] reductase